MSAMTCPNCNDPVGPDDNFCEACGTPLSLSADAPHPQTVEQDEPSAKPALPTVSASQLPCSNCGAGAGHIEDGFCNQCGLKQVSNSKEHVEVVHAPTLAGVTDRGKLHKINQDDMAFATESIDDSQVTVLVVCDGLSMAVDSDVASRLASTVALNSALTNLRAGMEPTKAVEEAIQAAQHAVCQQPFTPQEKRDSPATTIVMCVIKDGVVTTGWVGDSRAYAIMENEALELSHDHSWINLMVDSGQMTWEEASAAPEASMITRCLGLSQDGQAQPAEISTASRPLDSAKWLVLCSDGLWRYAAQKSDLLAKVKLYATGDAVTLARNLVQFANTQGGADNITVVALSL